MRLFLCEKPSQGKDIARILGATQRGSGCYTGAGVGVTWCIGHLVEAAPPEAYDERYKRWALEDLPIIPSAWRVTVKEDTAEQYNVVKRLLRQSTELVIATDADREGEMIAREILELFSYQGVIKRLWLSALNEASIRQALGRLRPGAETERLYHSALARSRADWLIGMNMSRLFTLLGRQNGYQGVLSVGRVQMPTLRLVVDRDRQIERFSPIAYWAIDFELCHDGHHFKAQWSPPPSACDKAGRCIRPAIAHQACRSFRTAANATIVGVQTERIEVAPPLPLDLSTLQQVCSRRLGLDVLETLNIAQSLYETHKATTYPRTDSGYLPESMWDEAESVLQSLVTTDSSLRALVQSVDRHHRSRAWNDENIRSHHGIIPTPEPFMLENLSKRERAVYGVIRAHYLVQFLPHHQYDRTCIQLSCAGEDLLATGKRVVVRGWHSALKSHLTDTEDDRTHRSQLLPALSPQDQCVVQRVDLREMKTQSPKAFTQGELIKSMKNVASRIADPRLKQTLKDSAGIGTEATRAAVISGLLNRKYLYTKGRSVRASPIAFALVDAVPAAIADPSTTAIWEQAFNKIETGEMTLEDFICKQTAWVTSLVEHFKTARLALHSSGGPSCPLCGAPMLQRRGKHGAFWSCTRYPECKGVLPVAKALIPGSHRKRRRSRPESP